MEYQTLLVRKDSRVDWLTLNRPEQLNALNDQMVNELLHYFGTLESDPTTRIVVMQGAGRAFCAGLDVKAHEGDGERNIVSGLIQQRRIADIALRMRRAPQAIISLVRGPACGGGFAMALASDIRLAGRSARMNAAFIRIGLSACDVGVSYFLPRVVGTSIAAELMMTGKFIEADRALSSGLVSQVAEDDQLETVVQPYLDQMLATSPLGLRLTKECLRMSVDAPSLEAAIAMEDRNQVLCALSTDFEEGMRAFIEKRPPRYAG